MGVWGTIRSPTHPSVRRLYRWSSLTPQDVGRGYASCPRARGRPVSACKATVVVTATIDRLSERNDETAFETEVVGQRAERDPTGGDSEREFRATMRRQRRKRRARRTTYARLSGGSRGHVGRRASWRRRRIVDVDGVGGRDDRRVTATNATSAQATTRTEDALATLSGAMRVAVRGEPDDVVVDERCEGGDELRRRRCRGS